MAEAPLTRDRAIHSVSVLVMYQNRFLARFDGTDRWLQRTFVVTTLAPSAGERDGRIITTSFAGADPGLITGRFGVDRVENRLPAPTSG